MTCEGPEWTGTLAHQSALPSDGCRRCWGLTHLYVFCSNGCTVLQRTRFNIRIFCSSRAPLPLCARHTSSFTTIFSPLSYLYLFLTPLRHVEKGCVVIMCGIKRIFWIVRSRSSYRPSKVLTNACKHMGDRTCYDRRK